MVLESRSGESRAAADAAARRLGSRASTRRGVASPRVTGVGESERKCAQRRMRREKMQFSSWNVRSLVNVSGSAETAFVRGENSLFSTGFIKFTTSLEFEDAVK